MLGRRVGAGAPSFTLFAATSIVAVLLAHVLMLVLLLRLPHKFVFLDQCIVDCMLDLPRDGAEASPHGIALWAGRHFPSSWSLPPANRTLGPVGAISDHERPWRWSSAGLAARAGENHAHDPRERWAACPLQRVRFRATPPAA